MRWRIAGLIAIGTMVVTAAAAQTTRPQRPAKPERGGLEIVRALPREHRPGNIAVTADGRIVMSQHQFYDPDLRIVELKADGGIVPFPNEAWSSAPAGRAIGLHAVFGIRADLEGVVWMLDRTPGSGFVGKLVGWDTKLDRLHRVIYLGRPVVAENAFLNDLAVDLEHDAIYIADTASGSDSALIVVDLESGLARRVLERHRSVTPENVPMIIDGERRTMPDGSEVRIGVNPITIDSAGDWVYYGPMSGTSLYRIRTADLLNRDLSDERLGERVERYGDKPICDGITIDGAGNVYITDLTRNAVGVTKPDGTYEILHQDDRLLSWPDGFAFGPDNYIYATVNQLHRSPFLNEGRDESNPPFYIVRFPALAPGKPGR
jgi:sugar lactone lactonase YvrE